MIKSLNWAAGVGILTLGLIGSTIAYPSTFQDPIPGEIFTEDESPELYCLAMNIYHEARADNLAGQYAVADVVLNRVKDTRYPNTICEVVKDGKYKESWKTKQYPNLPESERKFIPIRHQCQFSWWCDGRSDTAYDKDSWMRAQDIAEKLVYIGSYRGITEGATHYHATYVSPRWASELDQIGRIGSHIFYRWH